MGLCADCCKVSHRYGTSVTSEIDVEQLRRDPLPDHPALPQRLFLPLAIRAKAHRQRLQPSVVLLVDGLELIARYIPALALIGAIG